MPAETAIAKPKELNHPQNGSSDPLGPGGLKEFTFFEPKAEVPANDDKAQPNLPEPSADLITLRAVPLFSGVSPKRLPELLAVMDPTVFSPGQVVDIEHESGGKFHVITQGSVEFVTRNGNGQEVVIGRAGVGEFFGELALLLKEPSQIQIRAVDEVKTLSLDRAEFTSFINKHPKAALDIMGEMASRLTQIDKVLSQTVSQNPYTVLDENLSWSQKLADKFAETIGSWKFIGTQAAIIAAWIVLNAVGWFPHWDPYPFIFLNLALSCQAAFAAPIIMMSQNRHSARDRISAEVDHHVNVKTELQVGLMMKKLEELDASVKELKGVPKR